MNQITMFDGGNPLNIKKPIRIIELFAGYGSQALALKYLGADFTHWRISEWAIPSIFAYKDMHFPNDNKDYSAAYSDEELIKYFTEHCISADYNVPLTEEQLRKRKDLRKIYNAGFACNNKFSIVNMTAKDLAINDTDKYTYVMTYSFPCVLAGTLVDTDKGFKPIEEIQVGDYVRTHNNRYRDEMSKGEWREQECIMSSVRECIEVYGLGVDCEYEIISVDEVEQ